MKRNFPIILVLATSVISLRPLSAPIDQLVVSTPFARPRFVTFSIPPMNRRSILPTIYPIIPISSFPAAISSAKKTRQNEERKGGRQAEITPLGFDIERFAICSTWVWFSDLSHQQFEHDEISNKQMPCHTHGKTIWSMIEAEILP